MILPDYQGIGLGTKFLDIVAKYYINKGYDFGIVTSAKNLINTLRKKDNWCLFAYEKSRHTNNGSIDSLRKVRDECYTARFKYKRK